MKIKQITISIMALVFVAAVSSCSKYEEGPAISLTPKKDRVANTWVIVKAEENGQDVTDQFNQYELYLTADGDAQLTADYTVFNTTYQETYNGTWNFTNDKENISFDYTDDSQDGSYQILKLTEDEFWLRQVGEDLELQLATK